MNGRHLAGHAMQVGGLAAQGHAPSPQHALGRSERHRQGHVPERNHSLYSERGGHPRQFNLSDQEGLPLARGG